MRDSKLTLPVLIGILIVLIVLIVLMEIAFYETYNEEAASRNWYVSASDKDKSWVEDCSKKSQVIACKRRAYVLWGK